jgi:proline iminopeptidase
VAAWGKRVKSKSAARRRGAGWVWHDYERALSELIPESEALPESLKAATARKGEPSSPYFEWHYMAHDFFLKPNQLLKNAGRLKNIPGHIVQGRYDLLCPPATAEALAQVWGKQCRLEIVQGSGHSAGEPATIKALSKAVAGMGKRLAKGG